MSIIAATMCLRNAMLNSGLRPTSISTMRVTMPPEVFDLVKRKVEEEAGREVGGFAFEVAGFTFVRELKS